MVESVIAVDMKGRIVHLNPGAEAILEAPLAECQGRFLAEFARHLDLQNYVRECLEQDVPPPRDITLHGTNDRIFQAHGASLTEPEGERIGALVVLHEMTALYRLERIRRDFVANVSHELRTPITAIRGFAETLIDREDMPAADRNRQLAIIERQSSRLNLIVEDMT